MENLQIVEVKGIRVLTSAQIASCYETTCDCIKKNFHLNKGRFEEGKHYIVLVGDELKKFKNKVTFCHFDRNNVQNEVRNPHLAADKAKYQFNTQFKYAKHLYLWTEKGALLHAKSLNMDKAWEVYDYLVDFYFRANKKSEPEKAAIIPVTDTAETPVKNLAQKDVPKQAGYDIAPAFRELIALLPVEALDEMEKCFRGEKNGAIKLATTSILAEKMKRQLA